MAKQKGGLGRGLDSLLGSVPEETGKNAPTAKDEPTPKQERKLPIKQSVNDGESYISEDNVHVKSVTQRDVTSAPSKEETPVQTQDIADAPTGDTSMASIELIEPNPDQPRTSFKKEQLEELAESIQKNGLLQPIVVRKMGDRYQIIAGERRWQASNLAGITEVPIRVIEADDDEALTLALIENIQRSDLNPIEEAYGYRRMMERGKMTQTQVAQAVSKGRSTIANALRLLELPEDAQELLFEDRITAGHARAILSIPDKEGRAKLTQKLKEEQLSVREAEAIARLYSNKKEGKKSEKPPTPKSYKTVARSLSDTLHTDVRVKSSQGKNKIEIMFKDEADLQRLYSALMGE